MQITYQPDFSVNVFFNKCTGIRFLKYCSSGVGFQLPNSLLLLISRTPGKHYVYGGQVQRPRHICLFCFATAAASKQRTISFEQLLVTVTTFIVKKQCLVVFFSSHRDLWCNTSTPAVVSINRSYGISSNTLRTRTEAGYPSHGRCVNTPFPTKASCDSHAILVFGGFKLFCSTNTHFYKSILV